MAEIEKRKVKAERDIDEPKSESDPNAFAKMMAAALVILAGMAWFLTYDWPSGKEIGVGEFVLFWFREIIALVVVILVLLAMAFEKMRSKVRSDSDDKHDAKTKKPST